MGLIINNTQNYSPQMFHNCPNVWNAESMTNEPTSSTKSNNDKSRETETCNEFTLNHWSLKMVVLNILNYTHDFPQTVNYILQLLVYSISPARTGKSIMLNPYVSMDCITLINTQEWSVAHSFWVVPLLSLWQKQFSNGKVGPLKKKNSLETIQCVFLWLIMTHDSDATWICLHGVNNALAGADTHVWEILIIYW